ncbi:hypothetical protein, partial [Actinosynnema sp.]
AEQDRRAAELGAQTERADSLQRAHDHYRTVLTRIATLTDPRGVPDDAEQVRQTVAAVAALAQERPPV